MEALTRMFHGKNGRRRGVRRNHSLSTPRSNGGMTLLGMLERQQHETLVEAFRIIDVNEDGRISEGELRAMWANLGDKVTDQELRCMIQEADGNGDGEIDFDEFVTLFRNFGLGIGDYERFREQAKFAFAMTDLDRDGRISPQDMLRVMQRIGAKDCTIADSCAMLRCVGPDKDDRIDLPRFEKLLTAGTFVRSFTL